LHAEFTKALKDPEFAARMRGMGLEIYGTTPAEFAQYIRDESVKWGKVIRATGAKLD
jgi:tripartite-type tricarboxylate transporter receptor subunit TctC